jgi:hypothetical protein
MAPRRCNAAAALRLAALVALAAVCRAQVSPRLRMPIKTSRRHQLRL